MTSDHTHDDEKLLRMFNLTSEQVERDVERVENEDADDGIVGPVYYGLHMLPDHDEAMSSMTVKLPKSQLDQITAAAHRYHISRSEYVRRQLASSL